MKFSSTSIQVCKGASIVYFRNNVPFFRCPLFFTEYLSVQIKINKMVNSVNCHPSPSGFPLGIYISPECLQNFLSNLYIPSWMGKVFKFLVFTLLENGFVSQKLNLVIITHAPQQITHPHRQRFFLKSVPPTSRKGEENYEYHSLTDTRA